MARSFIQLRNTAQMAPQSCSYAQVGKSCPVCSFTATLKRLTSSLRSSTFNSLSSFTPFSSFTFSMISSKGSMSSLFTGFIPNTTSPYICTKRSYGPCGCNPPPDRPVNPSTTSSFKPRFRIVSIIPGIEARAPERTETNKGFSTSPNLEFIRFSMLAIAFSTSSLSSSTTLSFPKS